MPTYEEIKNGNKFSSELNKMQIYLNNRQIGWIIKKLKIEYAR